MVIDENVGAIITSIVIDASKDYTRYFNTVSGDHWNHYIPDIKDEFQQWFIAEGYTDEYRIFVKLVDHWILEDHLTKRLHLTVIMPTTLYMKFKLTWL